MSNNLVLFDPSTPAAVPDYIKNRTDLRHDVIAHESVPSITFRGSKWRLKKGDEETLLTKMVDGEKIPIPSISVIVVGINQKRSRTYFEGSFVEGENKSPSCWSTFGDRPDADVEDKQASNCAACPQAVKGSRITEAGKESTACQYFKRLAVIPVGLIGKAESALLLKVPQTSIWDKDNKEAEAQQKFAWDQYIKFLQARGVTSISTVVTKVTFDPNTAYPKLLFQAARWATEEEIDCANKLFEAESTQTIIGKEMPAVEKAEHEPEQKEADEEEIAPVPEKKPTPKAEVSKAKEPAKTKAAKPKAAPKEEPEESLDDKALEILDELEDIVGDDEEEEEEKPAAPPKKAERKVAKPTSKAKDSDDSDDFDLDDDGAPPKKAAPKAQSKQTLASTKGDVSDLAQDWD
ncbi:MAG TPA: hypothetical protein PKZ20_16745 [Rhodocyclaceae bacterium]|jgi:hypothetical protein|nr:hypothetical protein [Rhodocyclaceae bacterium]